MSGIYYLYYSSQNLRNHHPMEQSNTTHKTRRQIDVRFLLERIVFSILWFVNGLLLLRVLFHLLGANRSAPFIDWLYGVSNFFVAPFVGILPSPEIGTIAIDSASLVAIFIYFVTALAFVKFINLGRGTVKRR